jgi:bifunctional polynucleotide phosphatase/kinase
MSPGASEEGADYRASGKSSFFRKHFAPKYHHVNQDILKTRERCLQVAEEYLQSRRSVVVDNTNRNRATRAIWVALAARMDVPIRVFHFKTSIDLARHNNMYRAIYGPKDEPDRTILPLSAFTSYDTAFEMPEKDEGFDEIRTVNFVWEGTEEQKKLWSRYMLEVKR